MRMKTEQTSKPRPNKFVPGYPTGLFHFVVHPGEPDVEELGVSVVARPHFLVTSESRVIQGQGNATITIVTNHSRFHGQ